MPRALHVICGECVVCDDDVFRKYNNLTICEACRRFFSTYKDETVERWAEINDEWKITCDRKCEVTKKNRRCKTCRLAKCIRMGMEIKKTGQAESSPSPRGKAKRNPGPSGKSKLSLRGKKATPRKDGSKAKDTLPDLETAVEDKPTEETAQETVPEEEEAKIPLVASLHNLGNTCFLNSVVQVLRYTPTFEEKVATLACEITKTEKERTQLLQLKQASGDLVVETTEADLGAEILTWELVKTLNGVFRKMGVAEEKFMTGQSNFIAIRPYDLLDTVERLNPMFQGNLQQDAHEFLRCLVAYIQDASRELNKYRSKASGVQNDGCARESHSLYTSPKEVELLGGCKDDGTVKPKKDPAQSKSEKLNPKSRSSQRLSGGKAKDENGSAIERTAAHLNGNGIDSCKAKPAKKRRSLTELQNQDIELSGQKTIMDCLMKKPVKVDLDCPVVITNGAGEGSTGDKCEINGEVTVNRDMHGTSKLSMKRKAHNSDSDVLNNSDAAQETKTSNSDCAAEDAGRRLSGSKSLKKRRRCSLEDAGSATDSNIAGLEPTKTSDVTKAHEQGSKLSLLDQCVPQSKDVCQNDGSPATKLEGTRGPTSDSEMETSNTTKCPISASHPACVVAAVKPKTSIDKKQTARKTFGAPKAETGTEEQPSETSQQSCSKKEAVVKLDKHGITRYFIKESKPLSLSDIERHVGSVDDCIEELFQGSVALQTRCCECETVTERREEYQDISVAVRQSADDEEPDDLKSKEEDTQGTEPQPTEDCVIVEKVKRQNSGEDEFEWVKSSLGEVERLRDDNKYLCDRCTHLVEAERSMHYLSVPGVLTLHLKRFAMSQGMMGTFTKLTAHVPLPLVLPCIEDDCTDPENHRLQLYGVVAHTGFTLSCGHYTSYVRASPNHPALMDPEIVEQHPPKPVNPTSTNCSPELSFDADPNNNQDSNNNVDADPSLEGRAGESSHSAGGSTGAVDDEPVYWFECDDEVVTVLREDEFLAKVAPGHNTTNTPYLLFYQKMHIEN